MVNFYINAYLQQTFTLLIYTVHEFNAVLVLQKYFKNSSNSMEKIFCHLIYYVLLQANFHLRCPFLTYMLFSLSGVLPDYVIRRRFFPTTCSSHTNSWFPHLVYAYYTWKLISAHICLQHTWHLKFTKCSFCSNL